MSGRDNEIYEAWQRAGLRSGSRKREAVALALIHKSLQSNIQYSPTDINEDPLTSRLCATIDLHPVALRNQNFRPDLWIMDHSLLLESEHHDPLPVSNAFTSPLVNYFLTDWVFVSLIDNVLAASDAPTRNLSKAFKALEVAAKPVIVEHWEKAAIAHGFRRTVLRTRDYHADFKEVTLEINEANRPAIHYFVNEAINFACRAGTSAGATLSISADPMSPDLGSSSVNFYLFPPPAQPPQIPKKRRRVISPQPRPWWAWNPSPLPA